MEGLVVDGMRVVGGKRMDCWVLFMPEKGEKLRPSPHAQRASAGTRRGLLGAACHAAYE
jgi:hypothetical protein